MYKLQYLQRTREKKKEERKIAIEAVTKTMGLSEENQRLPSLSDRRGGGDGHT